MRPFVAGMLLLLAMENNLDAKHMDSDSGPVSRAERTGYTETSTYTDVMEFIAELQRKNAAVKLEYFATTPQGRKLPLVVLSKPSVTSPLDAAASGKPVVFVMANIHAGEVEGKEAMLHLMRDVSIGNLGGLLDKMVLLVAPIYNADGNDKIDINHRTEQNGPTGGVGQGELGGVGSQPRFHEDGITGSPRAHRQHLQPVGPAGCDRSAHDRRFVSWLRANLFPSVESKHGWPDHIAAARQAVARRHKDDG
ncbi:MAG TPA: M14 family zinc carboxypeptidase [Blastocatellia bacterium]|nr:M14 family zinc carboxypeptidase [Blastocatellia bacterium]